MARWYSQRRKAMYSRDLTKYGAIPAYGKICLSDPLSGLEHCEIGAECQFCKHPKGGCFALVTGYDEPEVEYYLCGHCARKMNYRFQLAQSIAYAYYSRFNQWKRQNRQINGLLCC